MWKCKKCGGEIIQKKISRDNLNAIYYQCDICGILNGELKEIAGWKEKKK